MLEPQYSRFLEDSVAELQNAYESGRRCNIYYSIITPKRKASFGLGLEEWLHENNISGVDSNDISENETLKGFVYTLISRGRLGFTDLAYPTRGKSVEILEGLIAQYAENISKFPNSKIFAQNKVLLDKGIKIAIDYMDKENYNYFYEKYAAECYGLDLEGETELQRARLFELHKEVKRDIEAETRKDPVKNVFHYIDIGLSLYAARKEALDQQVKVDDSDNALHSCGYLDMLLRHLIARQDKMRADIDSERQQLMSKGFESAEEGLIGLGDNERLLNDYSLTAMLEEVKGIERGVVGLQKNPISRLEHEMQRCVEKEDYEGAARLRDKIKQEKVHLNT